MEQYDVLIIGSDITTLTSALFLARKMRNVSVILEDENKDDDYEKISITDPENNRFQFKYQRNLIIPGFESGLFSKYMNVLGLNDSFLGEKIEYQTIINEENQFIKKMLSFESFKVYLVRYYPKQRDQVHRFFTDLDRHYLNFVSQQESMLVNRDYTLTSLMIEWGDYSLYDLLRKYFTDDKLIQEFECHHLVSGIGLENINSYNYFIDFFVGYKNGYYIPNKSIEEIKKVIITKLQIINPNIIQKRKIKKYVCDDSNRLSYVEDHEKKKIYAKYFVVHQDPMAFYQSNFPDKTDDMAIIKQYYPNLDTTLRVNSLFIAINQKPSSVGIQENEYYFKHGLETNGNLIRLVNYNLSDKAELSKKHGAIVIDFCYHDDQPVNQEELLHDVFQVFPKMKKCIVGIKLGKPKPYLSMLSEETVRKDRSINDQISIENGEHVQVFENLFVTGKWMRPESGIFGSFHNGIVNGDKIEERLFYGENDDSFYYITNDEIMMMIRHNYGKNLLGDKEVHINFHIGKSTYFIRTKGKNITIHHGNYSHPDLEIYTTNDKLSNLLLKKTTFDEVLKVGGLKYTGSKDLLYQAVTAFNLDDYQEIETLPQPMPKWSYLGVKFLFVYMLIYGTMSFLTNFILMIWLVPFAFVLSGGITLIKYRVYKQISWFEIFLNLLYLVFLVLSIFVKSFNQIYSDDLFLGVLGGVFFLSWFINRPIVHDFHRFDFRKDYANTRLFKVINNGLTLVWALIFLGILAGTYITGERYVSVLYNLVFLGIFLTYYYPVLYIKTNIKK